MKSKSVLVLLHDTTTLDALESPSNLSGNPNSCRMRHLPTGLPTLDRILGGGIRIGTITELVGQAGSGKTQLAMQLCCMAARYGQGAVYIDTERKVCIQRLQEICATRASASSVEQPSPSGCNDQPVEFSYSMASKSNGNDQFVRNDVVVDVHIHSFPYKSAQEVLANLTIHSPSSTQELLDALATTEEEILHRNQKADDKMHPMFPVRLLIVDSIAAPTRRDFGSDSAPQRASAVFTCAQILKRLADQLGLAIVVINQAVVENEGKFHGESMQAALGVSWHHCVSTRLLLTYERDSHGLSDKINNVFNQNCDREENGRFQDNSQARRLSVVKSNVAGLSNVNFYISTIGITEV